jgi:selenide,water dikinase
LESPDDAAIWKVDDERALAITTDFFTPVVDDPFKYGQIAAANALSDLYAMGAKPILALNVTAMPANLPIEIITEIIRGGAEKVRESGAVVAGGHTIQDEEPKYGLVAVGWVELDHMMTKAAAMPDDVVVLTKPIGTGVTTTALRAGEADVEDVEQVVSWMSQLNAQATELAREFELGSATDVTGFSLLGHAYEVCDASNAGMLMYLHSIPFFQNAYQYATRGFFPGGSANNRLFYEQFVRFENTIDDYAQMMLFDAQTSGGLLLMVPQEKWSEFYQQAEATNLPIWPIGKVVVGEGIQVIDGEFEITGSRSQKDDGIWFFPVSS